MQQPKRKQFIWLSLFLLGGSPAAFAALKETTPPPGTLPQRPDVAAESIVASKIHATNEMEIKAGHLAEQKGTTAEIRRYGTVLVRDHEFADRQVLGVAKQNNLRIEVPKPMTPMEALRMRLHQEQMRHLELVSGPAFDQAFLQMMKEGHDQAIDMLGTARDRMAPSSDLRALIIKLLPILEQHDRLAEDLRAAGVSK